jgi:hypothetical protein
VRKTHQLLQRYLCKAAAAARRQLCTIAGTLRLSSEVEDKSKFPAACSPRKQYYSMKQRMLEPMPFSAGPEKGQNRCETVICLTEGTRNVPILRGAGSRVQKMGRGEGVSSPVKRVKIVWMSNERFEASDLKQVNCFWKQVTSSTPSFEAHLL